MLNIIQNDFKTSETTFLDEMPPTAVPEMDITDIMHYIAISAELSITDATEIFAHELAHVAAGEKAGHGERWDEEFQKIFNEYNRIGRERFGEDGKEENIWNTCR